MGVIGVRSLPWFKTFFSTPLSRAKEQLTILPWGRDYIQARCNPGLTPPPAAPAPPSSPGRGSPTRPKEQKPRPEREARSCGPSWRPAWGLRQGFRSQKPS